MASAGRHAEFGRIAGEKCHRAYNTPPDAHLDSTRSGGLELSINATHVDQAGFGVEGSGETGPVTSTGPCVVYYH